MVLYWPLTRIGEDEFKIFLVSSEAVAVKNFLGKDMYLTHEFCQTPCWIGPFGYGPTDPFNQL